MPGAHETRWNDLGVVPVAAGPPVWQGAEGRTTNPLALTCFEADPLTAKHWRDVDPSI